MWEYGFLHSSWKYKLTDPFWKASWQYVSQIFFFSFFCSLWDLTSPTTDETLAFGSESRESWSLDHQEFPSVPDLKTYTFSSSMPFSKSILLTYVYKGLTTAMFTTVLAKDWKWPKRPSTGVLFIIQYTPANVWSLGWKDPLE